MPRKLDALQQELVDMGLRSIEDFENEPEEEEVDENVEDSEEKKKLEDSDEEIDEEENDEDDEDYPDHKSKGIPTKVFNKTRSELRETKEKLADLQAQLDARKERIEPELDEDAILASAKRIVGEDATEEQLENAKAQLTEIVKLNSSLTPKSNDEVADLKAKIAAMEDDKVFNKEWKGFEKDLRSKYPHATPEQLAEARDAMDELAHAEQFADKEFDYVHFKNKDIFDEILAKRQKKTFESRETYVSREDDDDEGTPESGDSIEKHLKLDAKMKKEAEAQDSDSGWRIMSNGKQIK